MVSNTNITFETNLSILSNTIAKFISPNCHARKTSTTLVRFLNILVILAKKNYSGCLVPTSFFCLLLVQEFCIDKCTLVKGFVQQGVSIVKGFLS